MHRIVIRHGIIKTIYTDQLPLGRLGLVVVKRASNVEFDPLTQGWVVTLTNGTELRGTPPWTKRADALAAEVEAVNATL